jgi:hypothetical protein
MQIKIIIFLLLVCTIFCSSTVLADSRWNVNVSGVDSGITKLLYPPELTPVQGQRWVMASATSKARLAMLYNIEENEAIAYGAKYMRYYQIWDSWKVTTSSDYSCSCRCDY